MPQETFRNAWGDFVALSQAGTVIFEFFLGTSRPSADDHLASTPRQLHGGLQRLGNLRIETDRPMRQEVVAHGSTNEVPFMELVRQAVNDDT
jgi:hypothetical protein